MKLRLISSLILLSMGAMAFENAAWNDIVKRAIEDRKNNREVLGYIKYEPIVLPSNLPKNPNAYLMSGNADPRKILNDVRLAGALHGRTEGIRRATLEAFSEVEAESDKNAAKLAVGEKYLEVLRHVTAEYEKLSDTQLLAEAQKVNVASGRPDSYGFQDGSKAGAALAAKSKYVESGTAKGKAEAEKVVDIKLDERAKNDAKLRATNEAKANLMKPEALQPAKTVEQNSDVDIKSRLFDEPEWENSPYYKPPVRQTNDKDSQVYLDNYRKAFSEAAKKAYQLVKPQARTEAARSMTYWFKNRYAKMDHTAVIADLTSQVKVGFLSSYGKGREDSYKKNFEAAYNAYAQEREKGYDGRVEASYLMVKDAILVNLSQNLKPSVEAKLIDDSNDGVFAPGEVGYFNLDVSNWGIATSDGDLVANIKGMDGLATMTQQEGLKKIVGRTRITVGKVLPIRIPEGMAVGTTVNLTLEVKFRGEVIKTAAMPLTVKYPFEASNLLVNAVPVAQATVALGEPFEVRADLVSNKMNNDKYAGVKLRPVLQIKSLDQDGTPSKKVTADFGIHDSKTQLTSLEDVSGAQVKPSAQFGQKKFRLEILEDNKLAGFKDFEISTTDPLPKVSANSEIQILMPDGTTPKASLLLITGDHAFAQTFKVEASKVHLNVAVVNEKVTPERRVVEILENCKNTPVIVDGRMLWVVKALNKSCPVLIAKHDAKFNVDELGGTLSGYDSEFEKDPFFVSPRKYSNGGLMFYEFDYFIGTSKERNLGAINFMRYAQSETEIKNWPAALAEFVIVNMLVEEKVAALATLTPTDKEFDLLKTSLANDLEKEIRDNRKWELDEYNPSNSMKITRVFRFMQAYKKLPPEARKHFFSFSERLKDSTGSVFSGMFNSRRTHVIDILQPLLDDASRAGF